MRGWRCWCSPPAPPPPSPPPPPSRTRTPPQEINRKTLALRPDPSPLTNPAGTATSGTACSPASVCGQARSAGSADFFRLSRRVDRKNGNGRAAGAAPRAPDCSGRRLHLGLLRISDEATCTPLLGEVAHGRAYAPVQKEKTRMSIGFPPADVSLKIPASARATDPLPGVRDVRANMGDAARDKSTFKGVAFFLISVIPYALGLTGFFLL